MKNIYKFFFIALLFTGCEDLDRQPLQTLGEDAFWQTASDAENAVNGVYNTLATNEMYRDLILQTDAAAPNLFSAFSFDWFLAISENRGWDDSNPRSVEIWGACYQGIVRANQVFANVPDIDMDPSLRNRFLGEASFLRALFYFHLTNFFGDVPLILDIQTIGEESLVSRNPKAEVVEQIFKDLDFAIANLPTKEEYSDKDLGRATRGAALALKSRVHLYQEEYAEVISAVDAVTALGYDLLPLEQWADQFLPAGENNDVESIFEVQFSGNTGSPTGSNFNNNAGIPQITPGGLYPTQNLADAFEEGDPRKELMIIFDGEEFAGIVFNADEQEAGFATTRLARQKSIIPQANIGGESDANFVVLRYAEMLLNLAEAENELNGPDGAYAPLNRIRNRVGLPSLSGLTQDEMRTAIKKERRLELAWEGQYYFDLLRWGPEDMKAAMESVTEVPGHTRFWEPKVMLWPVPRLEINVNPNLLPNNPGW